MKYIKEYRNQFKIPFDGGDGKMDQDHIEDALKDLMVMDVKDFKSSMGVSEINKMIQDLKVDYFEKHLKVTNNKILIEDVIVEFIKKYNLIDNKEIYTPHFLENYREGSRGRAFRDLLYDKNGNSYKLNLSKGFTEPGIELFTEFNKEITNDQIDEFLGELLKSRNGIIDVWRIMKLNTSKKNWGDGGQYNDPYEKIVKKYNGVGCAWTWDNERSVFTDWEDNYGQGTKWLLCGQVRFEDVDWGDTLLMNMNEFHTEMEIRIKQNVPVLIKGYELGESHRKLPKPMVVNTGNIYKE